LILHAGGVFGAAAADFCGKRLTGGSQRGIIFDDLVSVKFDTRQTAFWRCVPFYAKRWPAALDNGQLHIHPVVACREILRPSDA
jgi:hypothetical protein